MATDRAKALAIWSAIAAGGGAVGLLLGGVLTDLASWRWIFFVNVPVGVPSRSRRRGSSPSPDGAGAPDVRSARSGGGHGGPGGARVRDRQIERVWLGLARTIGLLARASCCSWDSSHRAPQPRRRSCGSASSACASLAAADLALLLTSAAVFAMFFFVSLYIQQILGYRPLRAGAAFLPFSAGIATGATLARKLVPSLGVRVVPLIGLALATAGMIVLTQLPTHGQLRIELAPRPPPAWPRHWGSHLSR